MRCWVQTRSSDEGTKVQEEDWTWDGEMIFAIFTGWCPKVPCDQRFVLMNVTSSNGV